LSIVQTWSSASLIVSALLIFGYELHLWYAGRRNPAATARSAHRTLRGEWVAALSKHPGSELLAVQALRNSLMSATINASTAALALMGSMSLIATRGSSSPQQLALELALAATLFASYVCSAFAMRYYHHAGFAMSLPIGSPVRESRMLLAAAYVQRAGVLYSWSLRCSLFVAPVVIGLVSPLLTLPASLVLIFVLALFDRPPTLPAG
jgi:hypothetical protein